MQRISASGAIKRRPSVLLRRQEMAGWLFALPWLWGILFFFVYPLVSSIYYSFHDFKGMTPMNFVGLTNYQRLLNDPLFWTSVKNTFTYAAMAVPMQVVFGILIAVLLNVNIRGRAIFRTIVFMPTLVPAVAVSIIWQWLLNSQFGIVNFALNTLGIKGPAWFGSVQWAKPSLVMISLWTIGSTVLIYLAGLQDIPGNLYEAAKLDGASVIQRTVHITLPLLTPVILYNMIMALINAFQQFTLSFVISNGTGGPADSLMFYTLYLYKNAFNYFEMGLASAMAWMMFVVIMTLTLVIYRSSGKWVHYMGE